eukprot:15157074-Alexandrium_andersonii.AAC.1
MLGRAEVCRKAWVGSRCARASTGSSAGFWLVTWSGSPMFSNSHIGILVGCAGCAKQDEARTP